MTKNDVVAGAVNVLVTLNDGSHSSAKIVGRDASTDAAVLKKRQLYVPPAASRVLHGDGYADQRGQLRRSAAYAGWQGHCYGHAMSTPSGSSVGIGFPIPSNVIKAILPKLEAAGHTLRGFIGIQSQAPTLKRAMSSFDRPRRTSERGCESSHIFRSPRVEAEGSANLGGSQATAMTSVNCAPLPAAN